MFGAADAEDFTETHCQDIGRARFQPGIADGLPTLDDLFNTGRLAVLQDEALRSILAQFLQAREDVRRDLEQIDSFSVNVITKHPDLFTPVLTRLPETNVETVVPRCNVAAMRADNAFFVGYVGQRHQLRAILPAGIRAPRPDPRATA